MAKPGDKLALSLSALREVQETKAEKVIRSAWLSRTHRERLLAAGFLREVLKGWYIVARPDEQSGESTSWYTTFWDFCGVYLNDRFGDEWCLGPEQSMALHCGNWNVPTQLLVRTAKGGNKPTDLLHGTSLFDVRLAVPPSSGIEVCNGLRVMSLPVALVGCSPGVFLQASVEMRTALSMCSSAIDLLRVLLEGGHSVVAGRLAGAFRNIGRSTIAEDILTAMRAAGFTVQEEDPFLTPSPTVFRQSEISPHVNRLRIAWATMRQEVMGAFPLAPGLPADKTAYLQSVEEVYQSDAWNSLSIEGYRVTEELVQRVARGDWNSESEEDKRHLDALAARGYWQAFEAVKASVARVLAGENSATVVRQDHSQWYRELFSPSVTAGIISPSDLAGYRNRPVFIRGSMYVPPSYERVGELISTFFDLLDAEPEAHVRAVLGHFFFVFIHPYGDGNGRLGRFLMNVMLASGGFTWIVVPLARRREYMTALEEGSVRGTLLPFARFLASLLGTR